MFDNITQKSVNAVCAKPTPDDDVGYQQAKAFFIHFQFCEQP